MTAYELRLLAELIAIGVMEVAPGGKRVQPKKCYGSAAAR